MDDIWARVDEAIDTDPLKLRDIVAEMLSRATRAGTAAAEWQAACEAHQADGEALMAAIERVRALHVIRGRNIHGDDVCAECSPLQPYPCPTIAALDAPSGADSDQTDANA